MSLMKILKKIGMQGFSQKAFANEIAILEFAIRTPTLLTLFHLRVVFCHWTGTKKSINKSAENNQ